MTAIVAVDAGEGSSAELFDGFLSLFWHPINL